VCGVVADMILGPHGPDRDGSPLTGVAALWHSLPSNTAEPRITPFSRDKLGREAKPLP
jgi:hypothetical protein